MEIHLGHIFNRQCYDLCRQNWARYDRALFGKVKILKDSDSLLFGSKGLEIHLCLLVIVGVQPEHSPRLRHVALLGGERAGEAAGTVPLSSHSRRYMNQC